MKATMDENTFCLGCALKIISLLNDVVAACYRLFKQRKSLHNNCLNDKNIPGLAFACLTEIFQLHFKFQPDQFLPKTELLRSRHIASRL